MLLSDVEPGLVTLVSGGTEATRLAALGDLAATALRAAAGAYYYHFIVPAGDVQSFTGVVRKSAGKRRAEHCHPRSLIDTLQFLRKPRTALTPAVRQSIVVQLSRLSGTTIANFDTMLLSQPESHISKAYRTALDVLDIVHPYCYIDQLRFERSIKELFVFEIDTLPMTVQAWLLSHRSDGINISVTVSSPTFQACHSESLGEVRSVVAKRPRQALSETWIVDRTEVERLERLAASFEENAIDTAYFPSETQRFHFESLCIARRIPHRVNGVHSLLHIPAVRALMAFLEWKVDQNESGLLTLLEFLGTPATSWDRFRAKHHLPHSLSRACYLVAHKGVENSPIADALDDISSLVTQSRMFDDGVAAIDAFKRWGEKHLSLDGSDAVNILLATVRSETSSSDMSALKELLYFAISDVPSAAPQICGSPTLEEIRSEKAFLVLPPDEDDGHEALAMLTIAKPKIDSQLIISTIDGGTHVTRER